MGFIKNNATTLKQVKIGTDTSKIHYIKRNGSIEWAKPYNLTVTKGSNVSTLSVYRKSTKVSSGVTSGTSATLSSGKQVFHGDVLHIDATAATGYHITSGTGEITVKGAVTVNPQVGRNQYKFKFEPRLINTSDDDAGLGYSTITDTSLNLTIPFGYDDNAQPTAVNTTLKAVSGSKTVLYNGYLFFPQSLTTDSPVYNYYPEVKNANRLMYDFSLNTWGANKTERVGTSDITEPVYFYKLVGTTLTLHSPISMIIKSSYNFSSVGSTELSSDDITLENGSSIVLWSDILTSDLNKLSGTKYTCEIPSSAAAAWTFDSTGKTSVLTKEVTLASWTASGGFNDSDIPASAEIPTPTQRLYSVAINVESSINKVILNSADLSTGYLFANIYGSWQPITSPTMSFSLPYGTTIQLARNHYSNMTGFTYSSDATSETKTITINGTNYTVDVYSKSYTVNSNNMNIPFYVTPTSYTITCNIGMGISSFNFSTTSKYGTAFSNQSYSSNKSFKVYYKDTCSYNGVVKTGFENAGPSATNEAVSTKTVTFTADPKRFKITILSTTGIYSYIYRSKSPYKGESTGYIYEGYNATGEYVTVNNPDPLLQQLRFTNGFSFYAYYGDVFTCSPTFEITLPTGSTAKIGKEYLNYSSSLTVDGAKNWQIIRKQITATVYFTNMNFFNSSTQYVKYCSGGTYKNSNSVSAGTTLEIDLDAGTPIYMYTCCKSSQNPGNSSCAVHNLGSNNPGAYVGTCYSQYSASLAMSSFSKITALPYNNENIEVVPKETKNSNFYLTLAPIIKTFARGYGVATTSASSPSYLYSAYEIQYSGSSVSGKYSCPHSETYSGSSSVTSYTILIAATAVLHTGTTRIETTWYCRSGVSGKVFFTNSPASSTTTGTYDSNVTSSDSVIPGVIVPTYGPYASARIKPYFHCSWNSFGKKYYAYYGATKYIRTYRRQYDGTSNTPSINLSSPTYSTIPGFSTSTNHSKTGSSSALAPSSYLTFNPSAYDSVSSSLTRDTYFLSSHNGSNYSSSLSSDMSKATFYAIDNTLGYTLSDMDTQMKTAMGGSYNYKIDYVYDRTYTNY